MKKLTALLLLIIMVFSLGACGGDGESANGKADGKNPQSSFGGSVSAGSYHGNYVYIPVTDHYYVKLDDGSEEARVGEKYTYFEVDGYSCHVSFDLGKVYCYYEENWYEDSNMYYEDYSEVQNAAPAMLSAMEEGLLYYLRAYGAEEEELGESLKEYYIGNETICGVDCWIFDSKGINGHYCKYWVDPANGAVLKTDSYEAGYVHTVTEYKINYTEMEQRLYPEDYDGVEVW